MSESHKDLVIDYLYDELPPDGRAAFEASMRTDPTLAAEVASLGHTRRLIQAAAEAPPVAPSALLAKLQRDARLAVSEAPEPSFWQKAAALLFQPAAGLAFVVAALIGVGAWVKFGANRAPAVTAEIGNLAVATEGDKKASAQSMHLTEVDPSDRVAPAAPGSPTAEGPSAEKPTAAFGESAEKRAEVAVVPIPSPSPVAAAGGKERALADPNSTDAEAVAAVNQFELQANRRIGTYDGKVVDLAGAAEAGPSDDAEPSTDAPSARQAAANEEAKKTVAAQTIIPVQMGTRRAGEDDVPADLRAPNFQGGSVASAGPQGAPASPAGAGTSAGTGASAGAGTSAANAAQGFAGELLGNADRPPVAPDVAAAAPAPSAAPPSAAPPSAAPPSAAPAATSAAPPPMVAVNGAQPAVVTAEEEPARAEPSREGVVSRAPAPAGDVAKDKTGQGAPASRLDTAEAHYRAQRYEQAIAELEAYLASASGTEASDARRRLAESYERVNRLEQAAAAYAALLESAPAYRYRAAVLVEAAHVEVQLGRLESARSLLQQALRDPAAQDAALRASGEARLAEVEALIAAREADRAAGRGGSSGGHGPAAAPKKRVVAKPMAPKYEQDLERPAEPAAPAK